LIDPHYQPDYRHMLAVLANRRPDRLPIYEHLVNIPVIERMLGVKIADEINGGTDDLHHFFSHFCRFYRQMTYDVVPFEVCITEFLPDTGAIYGGKPGPIQTRADYERYPWDEISGLFWRTAPPRLDAFLDALPPGMGALGGVGNGVLEISEDLVGLQYLAYMKADDPQLFSDLYQRIGDLMTAVWSEFLKRYADRFIICRMGDDFGFKTGTLLSPTDIRRYILPEYRKVLGLIKSYNKPFLWHSCGNIFSIMDDMISLGIDAKHSNEDIIAPFDQWIERYGQRIGLLGGVDVDFLCRSRPDEIIETVVENGARWRQKSRGFALGSGNSIPEYIPTENYLALLEAALRLRAEG
jgi:uroporphyrinogen decarboxylase